MLVLDACRPDKLGCYGYARETSPAIDSLAEDPDAVLFARHYVQGAWTKASTASLFTGLFAFQHGVLRGETMEPLPGRATEFVTSVLDERFETMAERFARLGYRTFAATKSRHLVASLGFAQGFDAYFSPEQLRGDLERVEKTLELVEDGERPFFGYVHLSGCHHPFPPKHRHPAIMARHGPELGYDEAARRAQGVDFTRSETRHRILDGGLTLEPSDVRFLHLVYDAELRHVDETHVARLLEGLRDAGRYDDTLIVLTADHGEELYEHGGYAHGHALWEEVIRVPLLVKFPAGRRPAALGTRVDAVTQSIDLLPSLLAFAGSEPPGELPGTDVFGGEPRGYAYAQTEIGWALVHEGFKYVEEEGRIRLFDLSTDPQERYDLARSRPERVAALRATSEALHRSLAIGPGEAPSIETELDDDAIEALRSLGYLR